MVAISSPAVDEDASCAVPSLIAEKGPQVVLVVDRCVTMGVTVDQLTVAWTRPTRLTTLPLAGTAGRAPSTMVPIGSPGHSVTHGSAESNVSVALRSLFTVMSEAGISQQPKPKRPWGRLAPRLTRLPGIVIGGPPGCFGRNVTSPVSIWTENTPELS